jgi:hypothetical protein
MRTSRRRSDLAILYEHPQWFEPLFAALDRAASPSRRSASPTTASIPRAAIRRRR